MTRRDLSAFSCSAGAHAALALYLLWPLTPGTSIGTTAAAQPPSITIFPVPQEDPRFPGLKPVDPAAGGRIQPLDQDSATVSIGDFTFDASTLVERAAVLFPFVSPGVSLEYFALHPGHERVLIYERPASPSALAAAAAAPPLELSEAAMQRLLDRSWSRRARWAAFESLRPLAATHHADDGALPQLFQRYTDDNALQPYQDMAIRDPRLWAQLGIVADHVRFIGFIRQYVAQHPGTRTSTSLLFLLDRLAEASEDGLQVLLDSAPERDLLWTRRSNPDAYRLAVQLRVHYHLEMLRLNLRSPAAIAGYYAGVRLDILDGILRTTPNGYRASDARFLIGAIHWREGRPDEALAAWRGAVPIAGDSYVAATTQLQAALREGNEQLRARQIDRVLKNELGRWLDRSYDRLKKFGYRFDTY